MLVPSDFCIESCNSRPTMSTPEPAGKVMTMVMGVVDGVDECAAAGRAVNSGAAQSEALSASLSVRASKVRTMCEEVRRVFMVVRWR